MFPFKTSPETLVTSTDKDSQMLAEKIASLSKDSNILDLSGINFSKIPNERLIKNIQNISHSVDTLNLTSTCLNLIPPNELIAVLEVLGQKRLNTLNLACNYLYKLSIDDLVKVLTCIPLSVQHINLDRNYFYHYSSDDRLKLLSALHSNLKYVDLSITFPSIQPAIEFKQQILSLNNLNFTVFMDGDEIPSCNSHAGILQL